MHAVTTGAVLALGDPALLAGYALAGATVVAATGPAEVCRAWDAVSGAEQEVVLVVLTPAAAAALGGRRGRPGSCLSVVIPG